MTELHIQKFLRGGGTIEQVEEQWGINAVQSVRYPSLYLFKYDQIESPMAAPIVQECRGLILDSASNWDIVAFPFTKFFNQGEPLAAPIDWSTAVVQEKLDGSLITMYLYGNQWNFATSGNPDAAGQVNGFDFTFNELAEMAYSKFRFRNFHSDYTYMWELTSPYNRVVVPHKVATLTLIGLRHKFTHQEVSANKAYGTLTDIPMVKEFPLTSLEDVLASLEHFDGLEQEGYVVVDGHFNRVKIKHPKYVALHHLRDSSGPKAMVQLILKNEGDEFLTYYPEFAGEFNALKLKYQMLQTVMNAGWHEVSDKARNMPRKVFAEFATKTKVPGYLFARLDGKCKNAGEYLAALPIDNLMRLMGVK